MAQNIAPAFAGLTGTGFTIMTSGGVNASGRNLFLVPGGDIIVTGSIAATTTNDVIVHRYNADGTLDTGFGTAGAASAVIGSGVNVRSAAMQADGKIIVVGTTANVGANTEFFIVRFNANGTLDTTFDADGKLTTQISSRQDSISSIVALPGGKVLVAGHSTNTALNSGSYRDLTLARYNDDGTLDTTFDTDGIVVTPVSNNSLDLANSVIVLSSGKYLALGHTSDATSQIFNATVVRYNADGSLDSGFGTGGILTLSTNSGDTSAQDAWQKVIELSNHKLLLAGYVTTGEGNGSTHIELIRLNADGSADSSFNGDGNGDGRVQLDIGDRLDIVYQVRELAGGKILLSGLSFYDAFRNYGILAQLNADGSFDTGFGTGGIVRSPFPIPADVAYHDFVVQLDGKIVVTGFRGAGVVGSSGVVLIRYNANGTLDTSYGTGAPDAVIAYTAGDAGVLLAPTATVHDANLAALNDYGGSFVLVARHGGVNASDVVGVSGGLEMTGGSGGAGTLKLNGIAIGTYIYSDTQGLKITFAPGTLEGQVNDTIHLLTYSNADAEVAPGVVQMDILFSDGNAGLQGTGGAGIATAISYINIADQPSIKTEGQMRDEKSGTMTFTVELDTTSASAVSVHWATGDGTARAGEDYVAASGVVTFQPGETTKQVTVNIIDDGVEEQNEYFLMHFTDPTGAVIAEDNAEAAALIARNDMAPVDLPTITAGEAVADEGEDFLGFIVMLDAPSTQTVFATYMVVAGSASSADFTPLTGSLIFAPGQVFARVDVPIVNDGFAEGNETISLHLTGATNAVVGTAAVQGTITDNDPGSVSGLTVTGSSGADILDGTFNADSITGGAGDDLIMGDEGNDTFAGGAGDDMYVVDHTGITIVEDASAGTDSVLVADLASFTLPANVENLSMAMGAVNATGNSADNDMLGNEASNLLAGSGGDDTLEGGGGNDTLDGGEGTDTARFHGNFALYAISAEVAMSDIIVTGNGGTSHLRNIEVLQFADRSFTLQDGTPAAEDLAGNAGENLIRGRDGNDSVSGEGGNDALYGDEGQDTLAGGTGDDVLDGGTGADSMAGGSGDDTYVVDSLDDIVDETSALARLKDPLAADPGGGIDTVIASINYSLASAIGAVENLSLALGSGARTAIGNSLANLITGNEGDNILIGGAGDDTIDGGEGLDTVVFSHERSNYAHSTSPNIYFGPPDENGVSGDRLVNIERVQFADVNVAHDFGEGEAAALTTKLIGALFGAMYNPRLPNFPLAQDVLAGKYLAMFDAGLSVEEVAAAAVASTEFAVLAGSHSNADYVDFVYANVVATPDPGFRDFLVILLDIGYFTQAELSVLAMQNPELLVQMQYEDFLGGLEYQPATLHIQAGNSAADTLNGSAADDSLFGREGNDVLNGMGGSDFVDGGSGIDTLVTGVDRAFAELHHTDAGLQVLGTGFSQSLYSVERLQFNDVSVAFDIEGNAGVAAKVVAAMFGPGFVLDRDLVGDYLSMLDAGMTYEEVMAAAAASSRFVDEAGSASNQDFVDHVIFNLLGPGYEAVSAPFVEALDNLLVTKAQLAVGAAESVYNLAHVDLVGLAASGLEFS